MENVPVCIAHPIISHNSLVLEKAPNYDELQFLQGDFQFFCYHTNECVICMFLENS